MAAAGELPLPIEIILTCSICQSTIPEIYQQPTSDKGFRDRASADDEEQVVTKLWLTECGHLTCGKHLVGGGVPFHPTGEQPQAPCPYCIQETGDHEKRALYGVRGWDEGMYDEAIPKTWFSSPPIQLGGEGDTMQAMRFQYLSLIRFGSNTLLKLRDLRQDRPELYRTAKDSITQCRKLQSQIDDLKKELAESQKCQTALKVWKEREPKILYYLGVFDEVTRENTKLRDQLTAMGYAVPVRKWSKDLPPTEIGKKVIQGTVIESVESSQTAPSATDVTTNKASNQNSVLGVENEGMPNLHNEPAVLGRRSASKRKREDGDKLNEILNKPFPALAREDSGRLMPPPPKPATNRTMPHIMSNKVGDEPTQEEMIEHTDQTSSNSTAGRRVSAPNVCLSSQSTSHHQRPPTDHPSHSIYISDLDVERHRTPPTQPIPKGIPRSDSASYFKSSDPSQSGSVQRYSVSSAADWRPRNNRLYAEPKTSYRIDQNGHYPTRKPLNLDRSLQDPVDLRYTPESFIRRQDVGHSPTHGRAMLQPHPPHLDPSFQPLRKFIDEPSYTTPSRARKYNNYSFSSPLGNVHIPPREAVTSPFFSRSPRLNHSGPVTFAARSKATSHILTSDDSWSQAPSPRIPHTSNTSNNLESRYTYMPPGPMRSPQAYTPVTPRRSFVTVDSTRDRNGLFKRPDHSQLHSQGTMGRHSPQISVRNLPHGTPPARTRSYPTNKDQYYDYGGEFAPSYHPQTPLPSLRSNTSWQPRKLPQRHQDLDLNAFLEGGIPAGTVVGKPSRR